MSPLIPPLSHAVGIDLGTSNSAVAYIDNGTPKIIPQKNGTLIIPSYVHATKQGIYSIGAEA